MKGIRGMRAAVVALLLWSGSAGAGPLFEAPEHALSLEVAQRLQSDAVVVPDRYRLARIDQNEIFRSINYDMPLVLNLFNDVEIRANVQKTKELANGSSFISGDLEDGGHFTIFLHNSGIVRGELHSIRGVYTLKSEGVDFNQVLIKQEDLSDLPRCGNDLDGDHAHHDHKQEWIPDQVRNDVPTGTTKKHHVISAKKKEIPASAGMTSDNTIDVLVVYTQRVEDHEGGPAQVRAAIENEVVKMNQVLSNSGLSHRQVRLAGMEKVDYVQNSNMYRDLQKLARIEEDNYGNYDFSVMDEVHPLIEKYQADLVHLFVKEARRACGIASTYELRHDNAEKVYCDGVDDVNSCLFNRRRERWKSRQGEFRFSVSSIECTSNYTFTHELGHSFGLWHDRASRLDLWESSDIEKGFFPFKPYAFGYKNPDFTVSCQLTVMDTSICNQGSFKIPYFSNPDLFFPIPDGYNSSSFNTNTPMGVPGDEYTIDLDGPVNASRAIDDVWDIVASLSDLDSENTVISSCNEGDIASNALSSSLSGQVSVSSAGGARNLMISFPVPDNCAGVFVTASSSSSAFSVSVTKVREGEFELSIRANPNNASCSTRRADVTVELNGVSGVSPASISVTQASNNQLCKSLSDSPANSTSLDLSGRNPSPSLRLADGTFAKFTQLKSLDLSGNLLGGFRPPIFDGLDRLESLDLSRNRFVSLPELAFSNLASLETLSLRANGMEDLHEAAFHAVEGGFSPLRSLDLGRNRLGAVPEFAFRDLVALESLRLDGNRIGGLGQYDLFGPNELRRLNLARNEIATVHSDAFAEAFGDGDGVPSRLTHLWLGGNRIASLPAGVFSELAELQVLDLSRNRLSEESDLGGALAGLDGLRSLDLSGNGLTGLPDGALSAMDEVEHLWLHRNSLADLPVGLLSELGGLQTLSLSGNEIAVLRDRAFEDLDALEELWLLDNRIESLTGRTFAGLGSLRLLSLGGNRLTRLPDGAFSDLAALESLWLRGNRIDAVAPGAFDGLGSLRFLDLYGNPLDQRPLPARACAFLRGVETLRLADGLSLEAICPN